MDGFHILFLRKKYYPLFLLCPPFSHLTSCTPTKSNLYLANSLAAAVSVPNILHTKSHVPFSFFRLYQSINPGPRHVFMFCIKASFYGAERSKPCPTPSWSTTARRLSTTAYSIYLQLPSILEAVPPSLA